MDLNFRCTETRQLHDCLGDSLMVECEGIPNESLEDIIRQIYSRLGEERFSILIKDTTNFSELK